MKNNQLAVIWDMDGTFLDTAECHFRSWEITLQGKAPYFDFQSYMKCFGQNNRSSLRTWFGYDLTDIDYRVLVEQKETLFRSKLSTETRLFPGVDKWITYLHNNGTKQAIASSASQANINAALAAFNLKPFFDCVIAGDQLPSKPAPEIFLAAAACLQVDPKNCVVIEDSQHGLDAAAQAGMLRICKQNPGTPHLPGANFYVEDFSVDPGEYFNKVLASL